MPIPRLRRAPTPVVRWAPHANSIELTREAGQRSSIQPVKRRPRAWQLRGLRPTRRRMRQRGCRPASFQESHHMVRYWIIKYFVSTIALPVERKTPELRCSDEYLCDASDYGKWFHYGQNICPLQPQLRNNRLKHVRPASAVCVSIGKHKIAKGEA